MYFQESSIFFPPLRNLMYLACLFVANHILHFVYLFYTICFIQKNVLWLTDFIRRVFLRIETDDVEKNNYLGMTVRPKLSTMERNRSNYRVSPKIRPNGKIIPSVIFQDDLP